MSGRQADIEEILGRRRDNGGDYWTTPDNTVGSLSLLHELELTDEDEAVRACLPCPSWPRASRRFGRRRSTRRWPYAPSNAVRAARGRHAAPFPQDLGLPAA